MYLQFQSTLENCVFYFKKGKGVWFCWDYTQNIVIHQTEIMIMKKEVYIWGKVLWNENNATEIQLHFQWICGKISRKGIRSVCYLSICFCEFNNFISSKIWWIKCKFLSEGSFYLMNFAYPAITEAEIHIHPCIFNNKLLLFYFTLANYGCRCSKMDFQLDWMLKKLL